MTKRGNKVIVVVVLVLVVLFGVGQFFTAGFGSPVSNSSTSAPTSPVQNSQGTKVIAYTPPILVSSTPVKKGSCFANSIAAPYRADAWRCTVGNLIADPCFELPLASATATQTLFCGANPSDTYATSTFVLKLTKDLPSSNLPKTTPPTDWAWFVELSDGTICKPFTGTRPFSASGDIAIYACDGAIKGENMIFGDLNNSSTMWTAEVGSLSTATSTFPPIIAASTTVPVYAVWQ